MLKICTFSTGTDTRLRAGVVTPDGEAVIDIAAATNGELPGAVVALFGLDGSLVGRLEGLLSSAGVTGASWVYSLDDVHLAPPVPDPPALFFGGYTSDEVLDQMSDEILSAMPEGSALPPAPIAPVWFFKPNQCLVGSGAPVIQPEACKRIMASAEFGLVIGRRAFRVPPSEAMSYVAGFTVMNDVTAVDLLTREPFIYTIPREKVYPTFAPVGPFVALAESSAEPDLAVYGFVDGQRVQETTTGAYEVRMADMVSHASFHLPLDPGTCLSMGGLPGTLNCVLVAGQEMGVEVEDVGLLSNPLISESEALDRGLLR